MAFPNPCPVAGDRNGQQTKGFVPIEGSSMLMIRERRPVIRTLRGWAISVLLEAGAIRECEEHS
jgi:hypothetical protein